VFSTADLRGAACAEALLAAGRLGDELGLPVYRYGVLAGGRTRADVRRGGPAALAVTAPAFGPPAIDPRHGATLVAARPPLVAFNFEIDGDVELARAAATRLRELPGVVALGLWLQSAGVAQVSCNVEDHEALALARLLEAVERHAPVTEAELVGLAPAAAFDGWPERVPIRNRATIEERLSS
jgi:glutamate formiminotransferase